MFLFLDYVYSSPSQKQTWYCTGGQCHGTFLTNKRFHHTPECRHPSMSHCTGGGWGRIVVVGSWTGWLTRSRLKFSLTFILNLLNTFRVQILGACSHFAVTGHFPHWINTGPFLVKKKKNRSPLGYMENDCFICVSFTPQCWNDVWCSAEKHSMSTFFPNTLDGTMHPAAVRRNEARNSHWHLTGW